MFLKDKKGIILIACYFVIVVLLILGSAFLFQSITEKNIAERERDYISAFYIAEGGLEQTLYDLKKDFENDSSPSWDDGKINNIFAGPNANSFYSLYSGIPLGNGNYTVELKNVVDTDDPDGIKDNEIWVKSTGTFGSLSRTIQTRLKIENPWLIKVPGVVYSKGVVRIKFDKRDDAYIDGKSIPGIYSTDEVKSKKEGEGRINGNPPILENQEMPEDLEDGIWDVFDMNALREIAKAKGTYFSAEGDDEYNNPYNKKGKYTLPVELDDGTKITEGVFFFDAKEGEPLDDDDINPKNEIRVKLEGTTELISGIIVVVGDLHIKDTNNYDFLFDGIILVLDDLKINDERHHRRYGTNDSDILIRGAILCDNVFEKGKRRKKEPTIDINNATIEYDTGAITDALFYWGIVLESWQEI